MDTLDQVQTIIDRLVGARPEKLPPANDLGDPRRHIYVRVARASSHQEAEARIRRAVKGLEDSSDLAEYLVNLLPSGKYFTAFPSFYETSGSSGTVQWLWPSWIPRGMITLFGAAPGAGKSLVALDLARRIIHGQPFPDRTPVPNPGANILIVDAEGTPALLKQRIQAWKLDSRRLFLMPPPDPDALINLSDPRQQDLLRGMCDDLQPALVVVDSLAAATARGETSIAGARDLLGFLATVARETDVPLLLIHHLRKRPPSTRGFPAPRVAAEDLRGSSHISAAARSVLALSLPGQPPDAPLPPEADLDPALSDAPPPSSPRRHAPPRGRQDQPLPPSPSPGARLRGRGPARPHAALYHVDRSASQIQPSPPVR